MYFRISDIPAHALAFVKKYAHPVHTTLVTILISVGPDPSAIRKAV
jgi:hypothetical protein